MDAMTNPIHTAETRNMRIAPPVPPLVSGMISVLLKVRDRLLDTTIHSRHDRLPSRHQNHRVREDRNRTKVASELLLLSHTVHILLVIDRSILIRIRKFRVQFIMRYLGCLVVLIFCHGVMRKLGDLCEITDFTVIFRPYLSRPKKNPGIVGEEETSDTNSAVLGEVYYWLILPLAWFMIRVTLEEDAHLRTGEGYSSSWSWHPCKDSGVLQRPISNFIGNYIFSRAQGCTP